MVTEAAFAVGLAFATGYGAQRGSLCVVTGIEQLLDRGSPRLLLAFSRASVWSIAVTVAILWLVPSAHPGTTYAIVAATLLGGVVFGIGAAVNGGCAFGTLTRLGAGDLSFAMTLAGIAIGIGAVHRIAPGGFNRPLGSTVLASPGPFGVAVLLGAVLFCAREATTRRTCPEAGRWPPEYSAILIGTAGGALYALLGDWSFTLLLQQSVVRGNAAETGRMIAVLVSLAALGGAIVGAVVARTFRLVAAPDTLARRLVGGTLMGIGGAVIPGGNGVLVLQAIPALSPHAVPAYVAIIGGAAGSMWMRRRRTRPRGATTAGRD